MTELRDGITRLHGIHEQRVMCARSHENEMLMFVSLLIDVKQCRESTKLNHTPLVGQQPRALTATKFCAITALFGISLGENLISNLGPVPYIIPIILET